MAARMKELNNLTLENVIQIRNIIQEQLSKIGKTFEEETISNSTAINHFITILDSLPDLHLPFLTFIQNKKDNALNEGMQEINVLYNELIAEAQEQYKGQEDVLKVVVDKFKQARKVELGRLGVPIVKQKLDNMLSSRTKNRGIQNLPEPIKQNLLSAIKDELGVEDETTILAEAEEKLNKAHRASAIARAEQIKVLNSQWDSIKNKGGRPNDPKTEAILFYLITGSERLGLNPVSTLGGWMHQIMEIVYKAHGLPISNNNEESLKAALSEHKRKRDAIRKTKPFRGR